MDTSKERTEMLALSHNNVKAAMIKMPHWALSNTAEMNEKLEKTLTTKQSQQRKKAM